MTQEPERHEPDNSVTVRCRLCGFPWPCIGATRTQEPEHGRVLSEEPAQGTDMADLVWKAGRYDYLLTNNPEATWQTERENRRLRDLIGELMGALDEIAKATAASGWQRRDTFIRRAALAALARAKEVMGSA